MEILIEVLKYSGLIILGVLIIIVIGILVYTFSFLQMKAWMSAFFEKDKNKKDNYAETFKN